MLTYRRHSDIGNGKSIYLRNLQASCFDPEVKSAYSETGKVFE